MPDTKRCCYTYSFIHDGETADDCVGVINEEYIRGGEDYPEGFFVQTCPRESWLGRVAGGVAFCGNGSDVVVLHASAVPSSEQIMQAVEEYKNDW